jgi:hypothetical protein
MCPKWLHPALERRERRRDEKAIALVGHYLSNPGGDAAPQGDVAFYGVDDGISVQVETH